MQADAGSDGSTPGVSLDSSLALLRRAKAGDRHALENLYARYLPRLSRWASGRLSPSTRHVHDTGDLVQEVLAKFLTKLDDFEPRHDGAIIVYLRTAILNRIRDLSRQSARRPEHARLDQTGSPVVRSELPSPFEECVAADTAERYEAALSRLDEDERAAVVMKVELAFDSAEIARALEKPTADAARMFVHRAILKLAREMNRR